MRLFRSLLNGFEEIWIGRVVGKRFYDIGNRYFENYVHTSLEVETKTDLHFLALLERVRAEPHFLVLYGIKILCAGYLSHFFSLACEVAGNK